MIWLVLAPIFIAIAALLGWGGVNYHRYENDHVHKWWRRHLW